jgi:hypothetical protein
MSLEIQSDEIWSTLRQFESIPADQRVRTSTIFSCIFLIDHLTSRLHADFNFFFRQAEILNRVINQSSESIVAHHSSILQALAHVPVVEGIVVIAHLLPLAAQASSAEALAALNAFLGSKVEVGSFIFFSVLLFSC